MAAVGMYGLIHYSVATRTQEIGIRMAIGARRADIFGLIVGEGLMLTVAGLTLGLVGTLSVGHAGSSLLFGVTPQRSVDVDDRVAVADGGGDRRIVFPGTTRAERRAERRIAAYVGTQRPRRPQGTRVTLASSKGASGAAARLCSASLRSLRSLRHRF